MARVKQGGQAKNDTHVRKVIEDTAESRYCSPDSPLGQLSLEAFVALALSFTSAEWSALKKDPISYQEALDYFLCDKFDLGKWWTYWRNLQVVRPALAKIFLLGMFLSLGCYPANEKAEVTCTYWQKDVTSLIDGVTHITSSLPLSELVESTSERASKRPKADSLHHGLRSAHNRETREWSGTVTPTADPTSAPTVLDGEDRQRQSQTSPQRASHNFNVSGKRKYCKPPILQTHVASVPAGTRLADGSSPTVGQSSPQGLSSGGTGKENPATMKSKVLRYMLARQPKLGKNIQRYVQDLTPERLRDLFTTIFNPIGLHHHELKDALADLWYCLASAEAYVMEAELNIPRSTCMCMEVDREGDYEVKVKVGRHEGLRFIRKYQLLFHTNFELSVTDLL